MMECPARAECQVKLQQMSEEESHLFFQALGNFAEVKESLEQRRRSSAESRTM
ncbi:hypothetical protein AOLI_G00141050 [Acnodon oligacanthus]